MACHRILSGLTIDAVVRDDKVTIAGYQGTQEPNQWFGGPAIASAGNMVLRDAAGLVVDSLNYGGLVNPWAAEGYQAESGTGKNGCSVPAPGGGRGAGGRGGGPAVATPNRSAGRFPDGADADSNCMDFLFQTATTFAAASAAGANNIKVAGVTDFAACQTITVNSGGNQETAAIASTGRGAGGGRGGRGGGATITVTAPLKSAREAGAQVSGTGISSSSCCSRCSAARRTKPARRWRWIPRPRHERTPN